MSPVIITVARKNRRPDMTETSGLFRSSRILEMRVNVLAVGSLCKVNPVPKPLFNLCSPWRIRLKTKMQLQLLNIQHYHPILSWSSSGCFPIKTSRHSLYYPNRFDSSQFLQCSERLCSPITLQLRLRGLTRQVGMLKQLSSSSDSHYSDM